MVQGVLFVLFNFSLLGRVLSNILGDQYQILSGSSSVIAFFNFYLLFLNLINSLPLLAYFLVLIILKYLFSRNFIEQFIRTSVQPVLESCIVMLSPLRKMKGKNILIAFLYSEG